MGDIKEEMKTLKKKMLETKYRATKMKNAFDRLLSRLDTAEERITELEGRLHNTQTEIRKDKE